jgi:hypothetical protein
MPVTIPYGLTNDGTYVYVIDVNGLIQKININTTIATSLTTLVSGGGMIYASGFLYVCNGGDYTIKKVDVTSGTTTTFAGISATQGNVDGALGVATFYYPTGITTDGTYFYVTDDTSTAGVAIIRRIDSSGTVATLSTGTPFGAANGIYYRNNKLYITDSTGSSIKSITLTDSPPYAFTNVLTSVNAVDIISLSDSELYYSGLDYTIHFWNGATNTILAGASGVSGYVDADGTNARFNGIYFMTYLLSSTSLYISDLNNNAIRNLITASPYTVTTFFGNGPTPIPCIPAGQLIRTLKGDVPVETVKSGDSILTPDGRSVVVKVLKSTALATKQYAPYLIPAHTFRPGYPKKDIQLSPHHKIQIGPDLWLSAEKASKMYPLIKQLVSNSLVRYFHFETPDFLTDDLIVEGSIVESYGTKYCEKYLKSKQPYVWSETHKAEIRMVPGSWRM